VARRLFDTGSFFGVGVPEAVVVGVLGWFLLGPEELYRLAKKVGNWLGELRGFVGQAAKQYESALDDESTRKAIDGIRETQRTISEVSQSWRTVADSLRDPLNISSTLESTYSKYAAKDDKKPEDQSTKAGSTFPEELTSEPEPLEASSSKPSSTAAESPEAIDGGGTSSSDEPRSSEEYLERLDRRLQDIDSMGDRLEELRQGIIEDRLAVRELLNAAKKREVPAATTGAPEISAAGVARVGAETQAEASAAPVPAAVVEQNAPKEVVRENSIKA